MSAAHAFCEVCQCAEPLDGNWWALRIDERGGLKVEPLSALNRYDTLACGQGTALALFERYLQSGSFAAPHELSLQPEPAAV